MSLLAIHRKSANEISIDDLQADSREWDHLLQINSEEINFLIEFLHSDALDYSGEVSEKISAYSEELENLKRQKNGLHILLHNHKNDFNGMMECEDISCDRFYHDQHEKLITQIHAYLLNFQDLKIELMRFCTPVLRNHHKETLIN